VQTFLTDYPYNNYGLHNLDTKRVVKQLLETRQIMAALAGATKGWTQHPATKMWRGKEDMLFDYGVINAQELDKRGYKWENNMETLVYFYTEIAEMRQTDGEFSDKTLNRIIYTHRGRLYEKDPEHYMSFFIYSDFRRFTCCERCDYYWPSHEKVGV
jgi:hypothetical protein